MRRPLLILAALLLAASFKVQAQTAVTLPPNDSIFRRARRMVADGNGVAGRLIVDSLLRVATEGSGDYGDALYWRGALAATAADAERDYRRVIVEYPLSLYVDDALLAMAELEQARGDRASALQHLQRFVREHAVASPARGVAAFAAARLAFEQRDTRTACGLIGDARTSTPSANVELRNQIEYYGTRCTGADAEVASAPPVAAPQSVASAATAKGATSPALPSVVPPVIAPTPTSPVRDSVLTTPKVTVPTMPAAPVVKPPASTSPAKTSPASTAKKPLPAPPVTPTVTKPVIPDTAKDNPDPAPVKPRGIYTIQVAAFNTKVEAERLVTKLAANHVKARVSNTTKPFRVRLEFYPTRQAATAEVQSLKARGIIGFVTTEEPDGKTP